MTSEKIRALMKHRNEDMKNNTHETMMQREIGTNEKQLNKNVRWGGDVKEHIDRKLFGLEMIESLCLRHKVSANSMVI